MTRLVVLRPHTHAGKAYSPGDAIAVSPAIVDWLIDQGIAQRDATTDATRTPLEKDYEEVNLQTFKNPPSLKKILGRHRFF